MVRDIFQRMENKNKKKLKLSGTQAIINAKQYG